MILDNQQKKRFESVSGLMFNWISSKKQYDHNPTPENRLRLRKSHEDYMLGCVGFHLDLATAEYNLKDHHFTGEPPPNIK